MVWSRQWWHHMLEVEHAWLHDKVKPFTRRACPRPVSAQIERCTRLRRVRRRARFASFQAGARQRAWATTADCRVRRYQSWSWASAISCSVLACSPMSETCVPAIYRVALTRARLKNGLSVAVVPFNRLNLGWFWRATDMQYRGKLDCNWSGELGNWMRRSEITGWA